MGRLCMDAFHGKKKREETAKTKTKNASRAYVCTVSHAQCGKDGRQGLRNLPEGARRFPRTCKRARAASRHSRLAGGAWIVRRRIGHGERLGHWGGGALCSLGSLAVLARRAACGAACCVLRLLLPAGPVRGGASVSRPFGGCPCSPGCASEREDASSSGALDPSAR